MAKTVLVLEDDSDIRTAMRMLLEDEGYDVVEAEDGERAVELAASRRPDLMLVDLRLPGISGLEVVRQVRPVSSVPIIVVTANTESSDVVAGLEAGADDYVMKPFVGKELTARIRSLLRRTAPHDHVGREFVVGELVVRPDAAQVFLRGAEVALTRTEFDLITHLAATPGEVYSRTDLLQEVWGYGYVGDGRLVDTLIYRVRSKIEDEPGTPARLLTVRGRGYKLVP